MKIAYPTTDTNVSDKDTNFDDIPCEFPECGNLPTERSEIHVCDKPFLDIYLCKPHETFALKYPMQFLELLVSYGLVTREQLKKAFNWKD